MTQRLHRIDFGRAAGGQVTGQQRRGEQQDDDERERQRVRRRDAVELVRDQAPRRQASSKSAAAPEDYGFHSWLENQPENAESLSAQGHSNANLPTTAPDQKGHDPIDA